jgi:hypothetical protein
VDYEAIAKRDSIAHTKHQHPLPLSCAGVNVGGNTTTDSMLMVLHGKGLFDDDDGHAGARFYKDPTGTIILKAVLGVDRFMEECAISLVNFPFEFVEGKLDSVPISKNLSAKTSLIKNISLGDSPAKVIRKYGAPNMDQQIEDARVLTYTDYLDLWDEVLFYEADFVFKDSKLVRISIYNGD